MVPESGDNKLLIFIPQCEIFKHFCQLSKISILFVVQKLFVVTRVRGVMLLVTAVAFYWSGINVATSLTARVHDYWCPEHGRRNQNVPLLNITEHWT